MIWQPNTGRAGVLPFRAASAGSGRINLLDKLASRPTVAVAQRPGSTLLEEQDATLSGMTRSLHRRLSGLNIPVAVDARVVRKVA